MKEERPGPVSRTRQRWGVAHCSLGTLAGGVGIFVAGSPDWLLNWGVMLGFGGLWCLGAFGFGARRDLRYTPAKGTLSPGLAKRRKRYELS